MPSLKYLQGYPEPLLAKVQQLLEQGRLDEYLNQRYPEHHAVQSDRALYHHAVALKQAYLRNAPGLDKVLYDSKLDVVRHALGLHTAVSRVHGGKLKAKKEIRIASVFREAPAPFLDMILVHELAHLREFEHNKAFYQLCEHMLPGYHQLEFDLRVWLSWREVSSASALKALQ